MNQKKLKPFLILCVISFTDQLLTITG